MSKLKLSAGVLLILISISLIFSIVFFGHFTGNRAGRVEVNSKIEANFLKDEKSEVVLLFFGYVGCQAICTPALDIIQNLYKEYNLKTEDNSLQVIFINLLSELEPNSVDAFAKSFNKDFKGEYLTKSEIYKISRDFKVYFSPSLTNKYELSHTAYIYLLIKDENSYNMKYIYTSYPPQKDEILKDLLEVNKILN